MIDVLRNLVCAERQARIAELEQRVAELQTKAWPGLPLTEVDKDAVEDALSDLDGWQRRQAYWWDDYRYRVPTPEGFGKVALRDSVDEKTYRDEFFDCDNYSDAMAALFARRYQCNAVGIVISPEAEPPHAFNVVILDGDDGLEARLWEPQSDEWITDSNDPKYTLDGALIRI